MLAAIPGVWGAGEDTAMAPLTTAVNQLLATQVGVAKERRGEGKQGRGDGKVGTRALRRPHRVCEPITPLKSLARMPTCVHRVCHSRTSWRSMGAGEPRRLGCGSELAWTGGYDAWQGMSE